MGLSLIQPGVNLTGNDELAQSLSLYFRTPKGSIPLHPELGFGIFGYVDRNWTAFIALIREVRIGIALWDNRIYVISAIPTFATGKLTMSVTWSPATDAGNIINSQFPILNT